MTDQQKDLKYYINMEFDQAFIAKLKKQDHNAFNEFYLKTIDMFFRYINANYRLPAQDAEDII